MCASLEFSLCSLYSQFIPVAWTVSLFFCKCFMILNSCVSTKQNGQLDFYLVKMRPATCWFCGYTGALLQSLQLAPLTDELCIWSELCGYYNSNPSGNPRHCLFMASLSIISSPSSINTSLISFHYKFLKKLIDHKGIKALASTSNWTIRLESKCSLLRPKCGGEIWFSWS